MGAWIKVTGQGGDPATSSGGGRWFYEYLAGMEMAYNEGASWASWRKSRPGCLTIPGVGRPKELGED